MLESVENLDETLVPAKVLDNDCLLYTPRCV